MLTLSQHGFLCCSGLWLRYSVYHMLPRRVCHRTDTFSKLPDPFVHLLRWQTCITILHFFFFDEFLWVWSLHYTKKWLTEFFSTLVHIAGGAAIFILLPCPCVAFLLHAATCLSIFRPCYYCYQLPGQSPCFEILWHFYGFCFWLPPHIYILLLIINVLILMQSSHFFSPVNLYSKLSRLLSLPSCKWNCLKCVYFYSVEVASAADGSW